MESHSRTIAKTLSWRVIATLITATLAWLITGELEVGIEIGLADTLVKLFAYYGHERAWARTNVGYQPDRPRMTGEHGDGI